MPAYYVAFDVLQADGQELLHLPYRERRARLQDLFANHALTAPWTLCPMTTDLTTAREWLESWTDVSGVEGILIKGQSQRYLPGYRGWTKIRRRDTTETVIGAVTGTLTRPQLLVLGRHDEAGRLRAVGRTVPLRPEQARQVAEHLAPAGPGHPWMGVKFAAAWGSRDILDGPPGPGRRDQRRPGHRPGWSLPSPTAVQPAAPGRHRGGRTRLRGRSDGCRRVSARAVDRHDDAPGSLGGVARDGLYLTVPGHARAYRRV
ncbi:hypothetical protein ACFWC9_40400 [Streptomyces goshikiensis]|uniref:ATP-dependent DNA ligase n=1 Tax=Streptomyces goshikiensis TaxID=1942 RepID=UPI0036BFA208